MAITKKVTCKELARILGRLVPPLEGIPVKRLVVDYDAEADVLYLSFRRPQKATDSELRDDGIIVRRRGKEIVGLTILNATSRLRVNGAQRRK